MSKDYKEDLSYREVPVSTKLAEGAKLVPSPIRKTHFNLGKPPEGVDYEPMVKLKPHIGTMLADSYNIIHKQLRMYWDKLEAGMVLDREEISQFDKLTSALVKLAREEREQDKREDPANLSDAKLLEMVEEAKKALGKG